MDKKISKQQSYFVVKDNALIQRTRYSLTLQQQKLLLFMISKIKPQDEPYKDYTMSIRDYCRVCGLDYDNGGNYAYIKQSLKHIADKSMWMRTNTGKHILLRWLDRVIIDENSGNIIFSFHRDMFPYLLNLQECYTQYSFLNVLSMRSTYSIRLYELLRSYMNMDSVIIMSLDDLRDRIGCEKYPRFSNFKQRVLDPAIDEINDDTDIEVEYQLDKVESRSYNRIKFYITNKLERQYTDYLIEKIKRERLGIT